MDLTGYRMTVWVCGHPDYLGLGEYFGTEKQRRRSPEEWVAIAEALAAENGGVLPYENWIRKNHPGLRGAMRNHPDLFAHIPQDKPYEHHKTPEQWVPFAEALAAQHGGVLPCRRWIERSLSGLASAMHKHSELFAHIPQDKPHGHFKIPEQWVPFAETLASKHGGVLPCVSWLQKNQSGLWNAMRKRPELFGHINQDKKSRAPEEWVPIAESLAVDHGGILPCYRWLLDNNHSGLAQAMYKHPELFAHINQDKPNGHHRSPEEWVPFAEELAAEHGGVLPCVSWVMKNHSGLYNAMSKYPGMFAHVKQERRNTRGRVIGFNEKPQV